MYMRVDTLKVLSIMHVLRIQHVEVSTKRRTGLFLIVFLVCYSLFDNSGLAV